MDQGPRLPGGRPDVGRVSIADEMQAFPLGEQGEKIREGSACGAKIPASNFPSRAGGKAALLLRGEPAGARMRGRVEAVDEPGARPHRGGDSERAVLGELEGLEVIEDDGLR